MTMIEMKMEIKEGFAPVNGLELYYEKYGRGEALILLHGGVSASEIFDPLLPQLTENRQTIAVHLQAHGRTADIDRPLSFELMADDIAAMLKHLGIKKTDILGYSLGGGVALQTAIRHPELVHRLVLISTPFKREGFYPEVLQGMAQVGPEAAKFMGESPLSRLYPNADWPVLFTKLGELLRQDYDWSKGVARIKLPVMLAYADADAVQPAHIIDFYRLLGGGRQDARMDGSGRPAARLAILPGMTHYDILSSPGLPGMINRFLEAAMPGTDGKGGPTSG
jgi:pimeloyl-ACP methyl ester carboxylesterase